MSLAARLLSRSMFRLSHSTLIFHRVLEQQDPMSPTEPTAEWFSGLIGELKRNFEIVPLHSALSTAREGRLSGRSLSITFDDGYADNYEVALPVLEQHQVPATFFVASDFLDGGRMWNDSIIEYFRAHPEGACPSGLDNGEVFELGDWSSRRHAASTTINAWKHLDPKVRLAKVQALINGAEGLSNSLMMSSDQLKAMATSNCAEIGGHTRTHPILCSTEPAVARAEIEGGKRDLEAIIDRPLRLFAYPNGKFGKDYASEHKALVSEAGFEGAVATDWGNLNASSDPYAIPRFTPWHKNYLRFIADLARCHHGLL